MNGQPYTQPGNAGPPAYGQTGQTNVNMAPYGTQQPYASAPYAPHATVPTDDGPKTNTNTTNSNSNSNSNSKSCCSIKLIIILVVLLIIGAVIAVIIIFVGKDKKNTIEITVQSSNTKQDWLEQMKADFEKQEQALSDGTLIKINLKHTGSGLKANLKPDIWSPANAQFIRIRGAEDGVVYVKDELESCYPVTDIPVGICMWKEMADVLGWTRGDPIGWDKIGRIALNKSGWSSLGYPQWGSFKYGHGHPAKSNSGRLNVVSIMSAFSNTSGIQTVNDVNIAGNDSEVKAIIQSVAHLGEIDTALLTRMRDFGPSYLHGVANYESNVVFWNIRDQAKIQSHGFNAKWVFIYLADGTFWMEHPLCVMDGGPWNTDPRKIEASNIFAKWATSKSNLEKLLKYGIRPTKVAKINDITCCGSTITKGNGADPTQELETTDFLIYPKQDVMTAAIAKWHTLKKPAAYALVIDTSSSMSIRDGVYTRLVYAKQAVLEFINNTDSQDFIYGLTFPQQIIETYNWTTGNGRDGMMQWVQGLGHQGNTPIYQKMLQAWDELFKLKTYNEANGIEMNYAILSMTDGEPSLTDVKYKDYFHRCLNGQKALGHPCYPNQIEGQVISSDIIHIFPVLFGDAKSSADFQKLAQVSGGKQYNTNTAELFEIYF